MNSRSIGYYYKEFNTINAKSLAVLEPLHIKLLGFFSDNNG